VSISPQYSPDGLATTPAPSSRDRLLSAFTQLLDHGIAAHPALAGSPDTTHKRLHDSIRAEYPHALCSYVFWTADDESRFDLHGVLHTTLTLHHSGPQAARAIHACLRAAGFVTVDGAAHTLVVAAGRPTPFAHYGQLP
jgi:hypothetical protein